MAPNPCHFESTSLPHRDSASRSDGRAMWVGLVGDLTFGGALLVAEEAGKVVGFIHFGPASENDEIGEVYGLYVLPSSWGTEAQALTDRAVASLAESFTLAILWTHTEAQRARRFCQETTWDGLAFPVVEYQRSSRVEMTGDLHPAMYWDIWPVRESFAHRQSSRRIVRFTHGQRRMHPGSASARHVYQALLRRHRGR